MNLLTVANRALQKLGAQRITSLNETTKNAKACNLCMEPVRDRLLRAHRWRFAIKRAQLAAEVPTPEWGRGYSYPLPSDYILMAQEYPEDQSYLIDYEIENGRILSDSGSPINIRYISRVTDPSVMDPLFAELWAAEMALEMCEELTQSNTKRVAIERDIERIEKKARRSNAIEVRPQTQPEDEWISARR